MPLRETSRSPRAGEPGRDHVLGAAEQPGAMSTARRVHDTTRTTSSWRRGRRTSSSTAMARSTRWTAVHRSTGRWRCSSFGSLRLRCRRSVASEITSPSTKDYDRGDKLSHYKQLASLQAVVLVSHRRQQLTVVRREGAAWTQTELRAGGGRPRVARATVTPRGRRAARGSRQSRLRCV